VTNYAVPKDAKQAEEEEKKRLEAFGKWLEEEEEEHPDGSKK
jgi:hypothetical protein